MSALVFRFISGLKYFLRLQTRFSVHSPFLYSWICKIHDRHYTRAPLSRKYRRQLLKERGSFVKNEKGAGSQKLGTERLISQEARVSGANKTYGSFLANCVAHMKAKRILELGTSLGIGTSFLIEGSKGKSEITSVDACSESQQIAREKLMAYYPDHSINLINKSFEEFFNSAEYGKFDFIVLDGDHRGVKVLEYIKLLKPIMEENAVIIIDDIRWTRDMYNAWRTLCEDKDFQLSLEYLRFGVLVKNENLSSEDYCLMTPLLKL